MGLQTKVDTTDLQRKMGALAKNLKPALLEGISEHLFFEARQAFQQQRSPEGIPWAALSLRYGLRKQLVAPGKPILQRRGWLLRSLFRRVQGDLAIAGATMPYAAAHQYGFRGTVTARSKKGTAYTRPGNLPARPFLPSPAHAEREAQRVADEIVSDVINREGAA